MKKYRKKPVVIEAVQFTGKNDVEVNEFAGLKIAEGTHCNIHTLEGDHIASVNDFIIRGVSGELYPCKPDIFSLTYEEVE